MSGRRGGGGAGQGALAVQERRPCSPLLLPGLPTCPPVHLLPSLSRPPPHPPTHTPTPHPPTQVIFTYDVIYRASDIRWASRWDTYLLATDDQVHWFSIINSLMIVLFLSGMVAMIMMRTLHRDISKYNQLETAEEAQEETGWKLVREGRRQRRLQARGVVNSGCEVQAGAAWQQRGQQRGQQRAAAAPTHPCTPAAPPRPPGARRCVPPARGRLVAGSAGGHGRAALLHDPGDHGVCHTGLPVARQPRRPHDRCAAALCVHGLLCRLLLRPPVQGVQGGCDGVGGPAGLGKACGGHTVRQGATCVGRVAAAQQPIPAR